MKVLDLRATRCPLSLVTLKRELLSTSDMAKGSLKVIFSSESTMSDIVLYLDKNSYQYQTFKEQDFLSLEITHYKGKAICSDS